MRVAVDYTELPESRNGRALVPTLGGLHRGHASLIEAARRQSEEVVVSIFVNPTQFRAGEDFDRYPRTPEADLALCEQFGVDWVYMPSVEDIYPLGLDAISVHAGGVGDGWEGAARPGHFDGVATVVTQLFLAVRPEMAVFGLKDLQQCAVIGRLTSALNLRVRLLFEPTVREPDGLALSSRNRYLTGEDRAIASQLYQALINAKQRLVEGANPDVFELLNTTSARLDSRFDLQYFALINRLTMQPCESDDSDAFLIIAAKLAGVRLIDNVPLREQIR